MKKREIDTEDALNRQEIETVLSEWGFARDCGDWATLKNCFQPSATINISWFSGTASEFIEQSKLMLSKLKPGEHGKHQIGRAKVRISQDRAISESHVELLRRVVGHSFDFDTVTWGRFIDLFERQQDGVWRIFQRTMVYEKDRLDPVNPADVPNGFFESLDLSKYPPACKILCYRLSLNGNTPMKNIIQAGTNREASLITQSNEWLNERQ